MYRGKLKFSKSMLLALSLILSFGAMKANAEVACSSTAYNFKLSGHIVEADDSTTASALQEASRDCLATILGNNFCKNINGGTYVLKYPGNNKCKFGSDFSDSCGQTFSCGDHKFGKLSAYGSYDYSRHCGLGGSYTCKSESQGCVNSRDQIETEWESLNKCGCRKDDECLGDEICLAGHCEYAITVCETANSLDCDKRDHVCFKGKCLRKTCNSTSDCATGTGYNLICYDGVCIDSSCQDGIDNDKDGIKDSKEIGSSKSALSTNPRNGYYPKANRLDEGCQYCAYRTNTFCSEGKPSGAGYDQDYWCLSRSYVPKTGNGFALYRKATYDPGVAGWVSHGIKVAESCFKAPVKSGQGAWIIKPRCAGVALDSDAYISTNDFVDIEFEDESDESLYNWAPYSYYRYDGQGRKRQVGENPGGRLNLDEIKSIIQNNAEEFAQSMTWDSFRYKIIQKNGGKKPKNISHVEIIYCPINTKDGDCIANSCVSTACR